MESETPAIDVRNVCYHVGGKRIIDGVSWRINAGGVAMRITPESGRYWPVCE